MTGGVIVAGGIVSSDYALGQEMPKDLIFRTKDPRNGEPQLSKLVQSWLTPTQHFYVRSHAPNPVIKPDAFQLTVEGKVRKPLTLSLHDLKQFAERQTVATLTCAGNRRTEFNAKGKVGGVQWEAGRHWKRDVGRRLAC